MRQPQSAVAGAPLPVSVEVEDALGNRVASSGAGIVLALGDNPGTGTLRGVTSLTTTGGLAAFGGLSVDRPGTGYTLTASSTGLAGAVSAPFDVATGDRARFAVGCDCGSAGGTAGCWPWALAGLLALARRRNGLSPRS